MIAAAEAWVNRMPAVGAAQRELVVSVRFLDPKATALLLRSEETTADRLVLDVRTAADAPTPGVAGYREPLTQPGYARIVVRCPGGGEWLITAIPSVY